MSLRRLRKPRLVIVDPINACLSSTDAPSLQSRIVSRTCGDCFAGWKHSLRGIASRLICVTHFTKAKGSALFRVTGSFAFVAAARSVFTVTRKEDDPDQRVLGPAKNNLAADGHPIAFRIEQRLTTGNILAPFVKFVSPSEAI